jgi:hypothetical protein
VDCVALNDVRPLSLEAFAVKAYHALAHATNAQAQGMVQSARIPFEMGNIVDPDETHRTFASTNQQTEGLTQTLPQKSHTPAKRGPTSVNVLMSTLGLLEQHCKTD